MPGGETLPREERIAMASGGLNPRQKYAVKKGFSILDWNLLSSKATDLAGTGGRGMRTITKAEVRQHRSEHDAWSIYEGRVYNITPFLHYHPGGVEMLMRGAGVDMTGLFNKYHRWVNAQNMIGNLCLGVLAKDGARGDDDDSDNEGKEADGEGTSAAAAAAAAATAAESTQMLPPPARPPR
ncbi:cytochrome b5-like heme/steroid binding domain-containing protein [Tribonema minus]|uniref:Cytochrome b5-like heme/steroid binding domain-containing protein n=1 Tax=Tribonema minus TaxID=303371 RepID=A0A835ZLC4_9STRA|nr:cytochrome b5-like heme/steroid binding domain-containing protein [Tribonema minus]